jgi:DNA-binding NarL/FixJ family response regulator
MNQYFKSIRVVIADDHAIFREGFKLLFKNQTDLALVGEAENGKELLQLCNDEHPDVAFVDIKMPVMNGIEACKELRKTNPHIKVIALSMFNDDYLLIDMLEAGANGYLLKNTDKHEMWRAVTSVYKGDNYYCDSTALKLAKLIASNRFHPHQQTKVVRFSTRETEVLKMLAQQLTNKEMAEKMDVSVRTIETYRETLNEKTNSKNSIGAVIYAIRHGIIEL